MAATPGLPKPFQDTLSRRRDMLASSASDSNSPPTLLISFACISNTCNVVLTSNSDRKAFATLVPHLLHDCGRMMQAS